MRRLSPQWMFDMFPFSFSQSSPGVPAFVFSSHISRCSGMSVAVHCIHSHGLALGDAEFDGAPPYPQESKWTSFSKKSSRTTPAMIARKRVILAPLLEGMGCIRSTTPRSKRVGRPVISERFPRTPATGDKSPWSLTGRLGGAQEQTD